MRLQPFNKYIKDVKKISSRNANIKLKKKSYILASRFTWESFEYTFQKYFIGGGKWNSSLVSAASTYVFPLFLFKKRSGWFSKIKLGGYDV